MGLGGVKVVDESSPFEVEMSGLVDSSRQDLEPRDAKT